MCWSSKVDRFRFVQSGVASFDSDGDASINCMWGWHSISDSLANVSPVANLEQNLLFLVSCSILPFSLTSLSRASAQAVAQGYVLRAGELSHSWTNKVSL